MASLKSLNSVTKKITKKQKNTGLKETFFGKSHDVNEAQFESDATEAAGPFLAKVIFIYNEDGDGKISHDTTFGGALTAIADFLGVGGETNNRVLTVKARLVDLYDACIPEPEVIGKAAMNKVGETDSGKSAVLIDLHDTFIALSSDANNLTLKVGDIIVVDYRDRKNKKNGFIIDKYWTSEAEGGRNPDGTIAYNFESANPQPTMPVQVTNPARGKCGKLFQEIECNKSGGKVVVTGRFGPFSQAELSALTPKLDSLKGYKNTAISSHSTEQSSNGYYVNVTYDYTKSSNLSGHPDLIVLVQTLFENVVRSWSSNGFKDPITPAIMTVGSSYRSYDAQLGLRRKNCPALTEAEIYSAPSSGMPGRSCTKNTAAPGKSMHERGEAIDFHHFDLKKWEESGFKTMSTIPNEMNPINYAPDLCNQKLNKWIHDNYQLIDLTHKVGELKTKGITQMSWKRYNTEGWHFSTNGY